MWSGCGRRKKERSDGARSGNFLEFTLAFELAKHITIIVDVYDIEVPDLFSALSYLILCISSNTKFNSSSIEGSIGRFLV